MATFREFEDLDDQPTKGTTYVFKPTGEVAIRRSIFGSENAFEEATTSVDVSANYEALPGFGNYDALLKKGRALIL